VTRRADFIGSAAIASLSKAKAAVDARVRAPGEQIAALSSFGAHPTAIRPIDEMQGPQTTFQRVKRPRPTFQGKPMLPRQAMSILFIGLLHSAAGADDMKPTDAIEIFRTAVANIRSFDVRLDVQVEALAKEEMTGFAQPSQSGDEPRPLIKFTPYAEGSVFPVHQERYHQIRQGRNGRLETLDPNSDKPISVLAGKGGIWKARRTGAASAVVQSEPFQAIPEGVDYRSLFSNGRGNAEFTTILTTRKHVRIIASEGGRPKGKIIIDAPPEKGTSVSSTGFLVTLDETHGFLPQSIDDYYIVNGAKMTTRLTTIDEFAQVVGSGWVPVRARTTYFVDTPSHTPVAVQRRITTVDRVRSSWNTRIPDAVFDLEIPRGLIVSDSTKKVIYVAGEQDAERNLNGLADEGRRIMANHGTSPPQASRHIYGMMFAAAMLAGAAVVIWLWVRRTPWKR